MRPLSQQLPTTTLATGEEGPGPTTLATGEERGYLEYDGYESTSAVSPFGEF